jgi:secreted trypsin-like serine protease
MDPLSNTLRQVDLAIQSHFECQYHYGQYFFPNTMMCAGSGNGKDVCEGDVGGPLVVKEGTGIWNLVGITSAVGFNCGSPMPGVFTRVQTYYNWLAGTINAN